MEYVSLDAASTGNDFNKSKGQLALILIRQGSIGLDFNQARVNWL
jgi:hypothetical protein